MASTSVVVRTNDQLELVKTVGESFYFAVKDIFDNVYKWWRNEIDGKSCAANIINGINTAIISIGAAVVGVIAGFLFGPVGSVVGGAVLSLAAKGVIDSSRKGIYELFDLPQSEAAEKAYAYLKINHRDSMEDIKKSYRELVKIHHPDKGGDESEFKKISSYMAIIKADKKMFSYDA